MSGYKTNGDIDNPRGEKSESNLVALNLDLPANLLLILSLAFHRLFYSGCEILIHFPAHLLGTKSPLTVSVSISPLFLLGRNLDRARCPISRQRRAIEEDMYLTGDYKLELCPIAWLVDLVIRVSFPLTWFLKISFLQIEWPVSINWWHATDSTPISDSDVSFLQTREVCLLSDVTQRSSHSMAQLLLSGGN